MKTLHSLRDFISLLKREQELTIISAPVDPYLEAAEITVRAMREGAKAILFENVRGSRFPLVVNTLASHRRVELALGAHPAELGEKLLGVAESILPPSPSKIWKKIKPLRSRLLSTRVRTASGGPSQAIISEAKLSSLPVLTTWPDDGGPFITLPHVVTEDPVTGKRNVGMYRMHVYDDRATGMHWQIVRGGGNHYWQAEQINHSLEVGVAIGVDPATTLATVAALPEGIDEMMFAGFLRGARTRLARGKNISIAVPAEAEFIFEGVVHPHERRTEGPFGDHFGHYSAAAQFPVFHLKAITHRTSPIFQATVVGKPPMEDKWIGDATQEILRPLIKLLHPEVEGIWAYYEAGFHNLLAIKTRQRYGKEAMKTALGIVSQGQLSLTKCAIVVDERADEKSFESLLAAIKNNFDARHDAMIISNVAGDTLDFTSYEMNLGSKLLIDATKKMNTTASGGNYPERKPSELLSLVGRDEKKNFSDVDPSIHEWKLLGETLLVVKIDSTIRQWKEIPSKLPSRELLEKIISKEYLPALPLGTKLVAIVSEDVDLRSSTEVIWGIFTRFDAARDVIFTETTLHNSVACYDGILGIDASWKPGYPMPCVMKEEVVKRVDERWKEFGI